MGFNQAVADWLKKYWRPGDFTVVPLATQNVKLGTLTRQSGAYEQTPAAEQIASRQNRPAVKRRPPKVQSKPPA